MLKTNHKIFVKEVIIKESSLWVKVRMPVWVEDNLQKIIKEV
jgi:hypothetical protein